MTMKGALWARALMLAKKAHGTAPRKFEGGLYVEHPIRVAEALSKWGTGEEMLAAAVLHDVLEDTDVTGDEILEATTPWVLELVTWMTNTSKMLGGRVPRHLRKKMDLARLSQAPAEAKFIKLLDRLDNVTGMLKNPSEEFRKLYADESVELAEAIGDVNMLLKAQLLHAAATLKASAG